MRKLIIKILSVFGLKPLAKRIYRSVSYVSSLRVNGKKILIPHIYGAVCRIDEPWMSQILKILFQIRKGAFIDVGVNLGQTLVLVKSIDADKKYVGFEPNASCIFYVEELIKINKFIDSKIIPAGLYTFDGVLTLELYADDITNSGGSLIQNFWEYKNYHVKRSLTVPVFSFETIKNSIDPDISVYTIIKIDVEGAELEVLQTLSDLINDNKPMIIIEVLSAYSEKNLLRVERQRKISELLNNMGYKIIKLFGDKNGHLKSYETIDHFDHNSNPNDCNYILYHESDTEILESSLNDHLYRSK